MGRFFKWKVNLPGEAWNEARIIPIPALRGATISMTPGEPLELGGVVLEHMLKHFSKKIEECDKDGNELKPEVVTPEPPEELVKEPEKNKKKKEEV